MTTIEVCALLRRVCCKVLAIRSNEIVDFGSGTIINGRGVIITARHVVSDGTRFHGDCLAVQFPGEPNLTRVRCLTAADLSIDTGARETRPFPIDVALLEPVVPLPASVAFIPLRRELAEIGEEAVLGGFPDDTHYPLSLAESFDKRGFAGMDKEKEFLRTEKLFRQLLCKKTMVGSRWNVSLGNWPRPGEKLVTATYTLDTDVSYGASGGAVADLQGRLIAVIAKRGLGAAEKFGITTVRGDTLAKLPTGTSHALAHSMATCLLSSADRSEA